MKARREKNGTETKNVSQIENGRTGINPVPDGW